MQAVRRISTMEDCRCSRHCRRHPAQWLSFAFRLDLAQLPRPLQIGTLGQSDWSVELSQEQLLDAE